jgi:hypothetical protein
LIIVNYNDGNSTSYAYDKLDNRTSDVNNPYFFTGGGYDPGGGGTPYNGSFPQLSGFFV